MEEYVMQMINEAVEKYGSQNVEKPKDENYRVYIHYIPKELRSSIDYDMYYIGITSDVPKVRWKKDGKGYKNNKYFWNVINKCGWNNIQHKIIIENLTKQQASDMEVELIAKFREYDKNCLFNIGDGGTDKRAYLDLKGRRFGMLEVMERVTIDGKSGKVWKCRCDCGNIAYKHTVQLTKENAHSCGCVLAEEARFYNRTHGKSYDKVYTKYQTMKYKCSNKNNHSYHLFGEKGVTVCDEWEKDFMSFYDWYTSFDNYENGVVVLNEGSKQFSPNGCHVQDVKDYMSERSIKANEMTYTFNNETHTLKEWAEITGVPYGTLAQRIRTLKWGYDAVFTIPYNAKISYDFKIEFNLKHRKNVFKVGKKYINSYIKRNGMPEGVSFTATGIFIFEEDSNIRKVG